ncbi:hydroxyethylthiazole kinase [Clostridium sardiniense]|uniref:Hydroxyethylthiazole kinase n=1 Tax=Clostridium sardiniense TaxID=29369 RepID=A0ABS7L0V0_CLOSR|nr:hydroxyethylthiazole kinase [Clostridium sardiniense]MBY0756689.1 hydroxyethylthiazole kinase [Clostridium sardiniense]MDQ0458563.1 hydroxyethylthiazole kinase [Clostridium sardiniense]
MEIREILKRANRYVVESPLVDSITNNVTMNDVAQTILSYGGKPMMIDDLKEIREGVAISNCLHINIGTMGYEKGNSMVLGTQVAKEKNIPVVLDPVGVHVTELRKTVVRNILDVGVSLIKGNLTEIKSLIGVKSNFIGIDSLDDGEFTDNLRSTLRTYARNNNCIIVITGKVDYITDGKREITIDNGVSELSLVTGTGCMLGGMFAVECGKNLGDNTIFGVAKAVLTMNISGEIAMENNEGEGIISFKHKTLDKISCLKDEDIIERGKITYEEF